MIRRRPLTPLLVCALLACAPDDAGPSAEQLQRRELVAREACIAGRLAARAEEELRALQQFQIASGPLAFQRAYAQHANLRLAALAHLDSALNHSRNAEDSVAHATAARGMQIRAPEAESVEENVIRSYEANFAAIFADADHPCNWQSELEGGD